MRILLYSSLAGDTGGAVRASYISEGLQRCGYDVVHVPPVMRTRPLKADFALSLPRYTLAALKTKCDVAIAVKPYPNTGLPLLIKKTMGSLIVMDVDDLDYAYRDGAWIGAIARQIQIPFPRFCDVVTYRNNNLRSHLTNEFSVRPDRLYKLDQGVDTRTFDSKCISPNRIKDIKQRYDLETKKIITYVAHLDVACDLSAILESLVGVKEEVPEACLLVVGGGPYQKRFEAMARSLDLNGQVRFTGLLPKNQVPPFIALADCCVAYYKDRPANGYRTSMKLREYLCMGKRVVCNDMAELKDHCQHVYQTTTSVKGFSEMLIKVLKGKSDGREIDGQEHVRENCSWDVLIKKFGDFLEDQVSLRTARLRK